MILPYFDYADIVYDKARQCDLDTLQRAQNKGLKICMSVNVMTDTNYVHSHSKDPKLFNRRKAHLRNFMYQRKTNESLLDVVDVGTRSRDAPLFKTKFPRNEAYKRSVLYNGATEWNSLSVDVRNVDHFLPFKYLQRQWRQLFHKLIVHFTVIILGSGLGEALLFLKPPSFFRLSVLFYLLETRLQSIEY